MFAPQPPRGSHLKCHPFILFQWTPPLAGLIGSKKSRRLDRYCRALCKKGRYGKIRAKELTLELEKKKNQLDLAHGNKSNKKADSI